MDGEQNTSFVFLSQMLWFSLKKKSPGQTTKIFYIKKKMRSLDVKKQEEPEFFFLVSESWNSPKVFSLKKEKHMLEFIL